MTIKFEQKIEEAALNDYPDMLGISQGSYRGSFVKGARFAHQIIMEDVKVLIKALGLTSKEADWEGFLYKSVNFPNKTLLKQVEALKNWRDKYE